MKTAYLFQSIVIYKRSFKVCILLILIQKTTQILTQLLNKSFRLTVTCTSNGQGI